MKKFFWRIGMTYWILKIGYMRSPIKAFRFSGEECWIDYFNEDYTPEEAMREDLSYA